MDFYWIDLPEPLWIIVLQKLDVKSLLNISATCTTFYNILENTILNNKFKFVIKGSPYKQLQKVTKQSDRKYRNLALLYFNQGASTKENFQSMISTLDLFFTYIKYVELFKFKISNNNLRLLIETLKNVETFHLTCVTAIESLKSTQKTETIINLLTMKDVEIEYDMDLFDKMKVKHLKIAGCNTNYHEPFLLNHMELQRLTAAIPMFKNNNLSNVKFSLEILQLCLASWSNKQYALNFIRTQTDLRQVYLSLGKDQYDILFLKHIINNNPNLYELVLELKGDSVKLFMNDIDQIDTNHSVEYLYFKCDPYNYSLAKRMFKLFKNNKTANENFKFLLL